MMSYNVFTLYSMPKSAMGLFRNLSPTLCLDDMLRHNFRIDA